jgi:hypothetical protein
MINGYNDPAKTPANNAEQIMNQSIYQEGTRVEKYLLDIATSSLSRTTRFSSRQTKSPGRVEAD